jgi:hypothetical protein
MVAAMWWGSWASRGERRGRGRGSSHQERRYMGNGVADGAVAGRVVAHVRSVRDER